MNSTMTREQAFVELTERTVHTARVEFAGGNDEGHAEDIEFLDADGAAIEHSLSLHHRADGAPKDTALSEALQQPIYDRWGHFDGDFTVYGSCIWHVPEHTVELDYSESRSTCRTRRWSEWRAWSTCASPPARPARHTKRLGKATMPPHAWS